MEYSAQYMMRFISVQQGTCSSIQKAHLLHIHELYLKIFICSIKEKILFYQKIFYNSIPQYKILNEFSGH